MEDIIRILAEKLAAHDREMEHTRVRIRIAESDLQNLADKAECLRTAIQILRKEHEARTFMDTIDKGK